MLYTDFISDNLNNLFSHAPGIQINQNDNIVIFSDLHMGNGSDRDDFRRNSNLFTDILENFYLPQNFKLILNGDIEELQKFTLKQICGQWQKIYNIFNEFLRTDNLYKIIGNHDYELIVNLKMNILPALKLEYTGNTIFIFHGHQASVFFEKYNKFSGFLIRYFVYPLHIKNRTTAYDSNRKYLVERKVYNFSKKNKIVSIIGHTHRPLFESLSRIDYLKFQIEQLCRTYIDASNSEKKQIMTDIKYYKNELEHSFKKDKNVESSASLYNTNLLVPCLFNSGCAIGKRGITTLEICNGQIALVHWFDKKISQKYLKHHDEHIPIRLNKTDYYRMTLKEDCLQYIFTRIKLLT